MLCLVRCHVDLVLSINQSLWSRVAIQWNKVLYKHTCVAKVLKTSWANFSFPALQMWRAKQHGCALRKRRGKKEGGKNLQNNIKKRNKTTTKTNNNDTKTNSCKENDVRRGRLWDCFWKKKGLHSVCRSQKIHSRNYLALCHVVLDCTLSCCTVCHCIVLYCLALYDVLYSVGSCSNVWHCVVWCCHVVLYGTVSCCTVWHCIVLHCLALYRVVLYGTVSCCTVWHCIMLYCLAL